MKEPHETAISRSTISVPAKYLKEQGLLSKPMLDYGSGKGKDAEVLGATAYDPHWAPKDLSKKTGKYKTILCTYVLNVVPKPEQLKIVRDIKRLLKPDGTAYITVRRDLTEWEGVQHHVKLDLPILHETAAYCIYEISKGTKKTDDKTPKTAAVPFPFCYWV